MSVQLDAAFNYNDLQGLDSLKQSARKEDPEALKAVAQQFESMFMNMIMSSMRDATDVLASDLESSYQTDFYRDMYDQQLSLTLSQQGGFGLADVLYEQLSGENSNTLTSTNGINIQGLDSALRSKIQALNYSDLNAKSSQVNDEDILAQTTSIIDSLQEDTDLKTPQQFIAELMPIAEKTAELLGVNPKILVAQAALETGWGEHMIELPEGASSNNYFGIKANGQWTGDSAQTTTHEYFDGTRVTVKDSFRAYETAEQSFQDYADFVTSNDRYQPALAVASDDQAYVETLQQAGYATDPEYAQKIIRISQSEWFENA